MPRPTRWTVATVATVVVLGGCGSDREPTAIEAAATARADQVRDLLIEAGFTAEAAEVGASLAAGPGTVHTVTYEIEQADTTSSVTITNAPPVRRVDVVIPGAPSRTTITDEERTISCVDGGEGWVCGDAPVRTELAAFSEQALTDGLLDVARTVEQFDLTVSARPLVGVEATCLVTTRRADVDPTVAAERAELCVSPEGVALLVSGTGAEIRATSYVAEVAGDAFEPPARVEPGLGPVR